MEGISDMDIPGMKTKVGTCSRDEKPRLVRVACALRGMLDDVIQGAGESPDIRNLLEYAAQNMTIESVSSQGPSIERKVVQTEESVSICAHSCAHHAKLMDIALWSKLPEDLQELVFARLPCSQINRVRILSKGWNQKLKSRAKDSQFRRTCASAQPKSFGLLEPGLLPGLFTVNMFDLASNRWHTFETSPGRYYRKGSKVQGVSASDGGLVCFVSKVADRNIPINVLVCNPLTRVWKELPSLYGMHQQKIMVQLIMDRETKHYRVIVVGYCKDPKVGNLVTVYHSETRQWTKADGFSSGEVVYGYLYNFNSDRFGRARGSYNFADGLVHESAGANFPKIYARRSELVKDHLFCLKQLQPADRGLPPFCIEEYQAVHCGASWTLLKEYPFNRLLTETPQHFQYDDLHFFACKDFFLLTAPKYLGEEPSEENIRDILWLYEFSAEEWRELPMMPGGIEFFLNQEQMFELRFDSVP